MESKETTSDIKSHQPAELFGLIGYPLGHSFSAKFFADKFERENIDAAYHNFEIEQADRLIDIVKTHPTLKGFNVTIPHKQAVIPFLYDMSEEARAIGAVNVVRVIRQGDDFKLKGYNSDVIGFCRSLQPLLRPHHTKALVLGTGGASKAVMYGLRKLGIVPTYVSRTRRDGVLAYEDLTQDIISKHQVIVNCSPVGMFPHIDECPDIPYHFLTSDHLLYDLVYNPLETLFLKKGAAQGATTKNGLEMLHLQALASWDFWHE